MARGTIGGAKSMARCPLLPRELFAFCRSVVTGVTVGTDVQAEVRDCDGTVIPLWFGREGVTRDTELQGNAEKMTLNGNLIRDQSPTERNHSNERQNTQLKPSTSESNHRTKVKVLTSLCGGSCGDCFANNGASDIWAVNSFNVGVSGRGSCSVSIAIAANDLN